MRDLSWALRFFLARLRLLLELLGIGGQTELVCVCTLSGHHWKLAAVVLIIIRTEFLNPRLCSLRRRGYLAVLMGRGAATYGSTTLAIKIVLDHFIRVSLLIVVRVPIVEIINDFLVGNFLNPSLEVAHNILIVEAA